MLYLPLVQSTSTYSQKFSQEHEILKDIKGEKSEEKIIEALPNNIQARYYYWSFYGKGIFESPKIFLFGHQSRPDRNKYPSAHNYYLDLLYNFGALSIFPFIYLIGLTIRKSWKCFKAGLLTPSMLMLIAMVGFFVFADNSFKVSFRQPYPGMTMFFLWGVLLTRFSLLESSNKEMHSQ